MLNSFSRCLEGGKGFTDLVISLGVKENVICTAAL
jgi:hypothetical protein